MAFTADKIEDQGDKKRDFVCGNCRFYIEEEDWKAI